MTLKSGRHALAESIFIGRQFADMSAIESEANVNLQTITDRSYLMIGDQRRAIRKDATQAVDQVKNALGERIVLHS
jgi:hypothetical protein